MTCERAAQIQQLVVFAGPDTLSFSRRGRRRSVRGQSLFQEIALALQRPDGFFRFELLAAVQHQAFHAPRGFSCRLGAEVKERAFQAVSQAADFREIARLQGGVQWRS